MMVSTSSLMAASTTPATCSRAHSASASPGAVCRGNANKSINLFESRRLSVDEEPPLPWPTAFPRLKGGLCSPSNTKSGCTGSINSLRSRKNNVRTSGLVPPRPAWALNSHIDMSIAIRSGRDVCFRCVTASLEREMRSPGPSSLKSLT